MLKFEKFVLGELSTNCYVVWEPLSSEAVVIDPADSGVELGEEIARRKLKLTRVLGTHGHFDHLLGALDLKLIFNIPLCLSEKDKFLLGRQRQTAQYFLGHKVAAPDIKFIDEDLDKTGEIEIGREKLAVIKTPGHTPGGVCFYAEPNQLLFSGDMIFSDGGTGSTEHKYSSPEEMKQSLRKLLDLPEDTFVLPGHGEGGFISDFRRQFDY